MKRDDILKLLVDPETDRAAFVERYNLLVAVVAAMAPGRAVAGEPEPVIRDKRKR